MIGLLMGAGVVAGVVAFVWWLGCAIGRLLDLMDDQ